MVVPSTRSIVPRALRSPAERALRAVLRRIPPRVQRLGLLALTPMMKRWPTVLGLLGIALPEPATTKPAPRRPPPAPAQAPASPVPAPRFDALLLRLAADVEPAARARAARELAEQVVPEVTAALIAALRDPSAEVATEATEALRHHPARDVVPALRAVVANADGFFNTAVRAGAIRTLSSVLPRGEGAPLAAAVSDGDAAVSIAAIAGIVDRGEPSGTDALLSVLENPNGFFLHLTRSAAARGLGALDQNQVARLRTILDRESDGDLREILARVLRSQVTVVGQA